MIRMRLSEAASILATEVNGADALFAGVSTDTRKLQAGELFCALNGPNFDGHEYCDQALRSGAAGAVVSQETTVELPTLTVRDPRDALGHLASAWRDRFSIPVVGITGSNGKTTVKEMVTAIVSADAAVLATSGNLNNDIGVPQTIFRLNETHRFAIIEMGANHIGEIDNLAAIAKPEIGVITLCAPAHLEGFGTVDNVAKAKAELYAKLPAHGTAVINADDEYAAYWNGIANERNIVHFAIENQADVTAKDILSLGIGNGTRFTLVTPLGKIAIALPFDGLHNVSNALAAAATAMVLEFSLADIKRGLERSVRVAGRLVAIAGMRGSRLIDDTYNANPTSLIAALRVLHSEPDGEKWLVLGDMGELGSQSDEFHREAGAAAREFKVDRLFAFGPLAEAAVVGFGDGAAGYEDMQTLIRALRDDLHERVIMLVKGSRAMCMERIIHALAEVAPAC